MSNPVATFEVYFLQSEWLANRSDLVGVTCNTSNQSYRRITLTTCPLYNGISREIIGEYTSSYTQIENLNHKYINVLTNAMINLPDKLILPNVTTGSINTKTDKYSNNVYAIPPRTWTQDNYGKKVLILHQNIKQEDKPDTFRFKIEVYAEDF